MVVCIVPATQKAEDEGSLEPSSKSAGPTQPNLVSERRGKGRERGRRREKEKKKEKEREKKR